MDVRNRSGVFSLARDTACHWPHFLMSGLNVIRKPSSAPAGAGEVDYRFHGFRVAPAAPLRRSTRGYNPAPRWAAGAKTGQRIRVRFERARRLLFPRPFAWLQSCALPGEDRSTHSNPPRRPGGALDCSHGWSAGSPTGDPERNPWEGGDFHCRPGRGGGSVRTAGRASDVVPQDHPLKRCGQVRPT
jgi:hypothetical protein